MKVEKIPISHKILLAVFITFLTSFHASAQLQAGEGYVGVDGGKIWYRVVGSGSETPLLLLHGGPGSPSYYLNPLSPLAKDRPVIFFDQLGCGRSDRITDTALMTIDNYVAQVEQLRQALGLKEFFLYGHSWGTMLAIDYWLKHPHGIKAMVFSSPLFSTNLWIKDARVLISTLPDSVQQTINTHEENRTYSSPEYQRAVQFYYSRFLFRTNNDLPDRDSSDKSFGANVYNYMWGPSEFTATGTLKNYDRLQELQQIDKPVLLTCGEFDEVRIPTLKYYQRLVKNSKLKVIKNSGHVTMIDNPEDNNKAIRRFLRKAEKD